MNAKIIKFIGFSGSGKTTLIEKIVRKLVSDNIKVATIKHDVHGLDIDKPGKDSYKYSEAGANISIVSSPDMTVFKLHKRLTLEDIIINIKDVDIIIIEGYSSNGEYPTISVARKEIAKGIKGDIDKLIAIISDYKKEELENLNFKGKIFDINNIDQILSYIKNM